jgi:hypothetical protein
MDQQIEEELVAARAAVAEAEAEYGEAGRGLFTAMQENRRYGGGPLAENDPARERNRRAEATLGSAKARLAAAERAAGIVDPERWTLLGVIIPVSEADPRFTLDPAVPVGFLHVSASIDPRVLGALLGPPFREDDVTCAGREPLGDSLKPEGEPRQDMGAGDEESPPTND